MKSSWFFLDTHAPGRYRLGWLSLETGVEVKTYRGRAAGLLTRLFSKDRERLAQVLGICVVSGPGSFSAIRIGVLYANLLSRLFRVPLIGVEYEQTLDLAGLSQQLHQGALTTSEYVTPIYDAAPNITLPRAL